MPQPARHALREREAEGRDSDHDFGTELRHLGGKHVGDRVEYTEAGLIGDQRRDRPRAVSRQHPYGQEQMAAVGQPRRVACLVAGRGEDRVVGPQEVLPEIMRGRGSGHQEWAPPFGAVGVTPQALLLDVEEALVDEFVDAEGA
jgi:hypothetical protein